MAEETLTPQQDELSANAHATYKRIWQNFHIDRKKSRSTAYKNLQLALSEHAADLVPYYFSASEHMKMVAQVEEWTKADKETDAGDPVKAVSEWLRGDLELSRIPLEGIRKN